MSKLHSTAIIHPMAQLDSTVQIGAYAVIGPNVVVGANTVIASHAVIHKNTTLGQDNHICSFSSIGGDSQSQHDQPSDESYLAVGDHNVFHEYCSINRGSIHDSGKTMIGNHNIFMANTHVGHDCRLADHIVMVNWSGMAGHVVVDSHVTIGNGGRVRQFCSLGEGVFMDYSTSVTKDVMPYTILRGEPPKLLGLNKIGLQRRGFSTDTMVALEEAYRIVFRRGLTTDVALTALNELTASCQEVKKMYDFMKNSKRGLVR